ncbi:dynein light chain Tctex-type protein 2B-like [Saccoglossus kowalevskii]|uniref:Tctex1 domain-containing protein 1-B-like n=1 Tax=Saccoglossus kowalevskii TaxID=10224 RepID=A0ABM0MIA1_SACKO|nr:PREDICTED: tctex1 domain-containing protein 1-B-like [Saccoglossus kowalevskii]
MATTASFPPLKKTTLQLHDHQQPGRRLSIRKVSTDRRMSIASMNSNGEGSRKRASVASLGAMTQTGRRLSRIGSIWGTGGGKAVTAPSQQSNQRPQIKYENTYKMKPDSNCKFDITKVRKIIKSNMELMLADTRYNPVSAKVASTQLSEQIKQSVRDQGYARYKLVCHVFIGERKGQGLEVASQSVWDASTDNFATESYENSSLYAVASVYGIYYE